MHKKQYYIVNGITIYRVVASVVLIILVVMGNVDLFKWLLALSFFTDAIDGFLARHYKVASVMGARIDSLGDDLTMLAAIIGVWVLKPDFIHHELFLVVVLLALYALQTIMALVRYGKISSFHTYMAKCAAVLQGLFLILIFFLPQWPLTLFYVASIVTIIDLLEEMILVVLLPKWETDVKGIYWVSKRKSNAQ